MSTKPLSRKEVYYPESDGKPMAETDVHRDLMVDVIARLRYRFVGQRVYVSGNLLMYYVEGNPKKSVAPDTFVVKDCDPRRRRIFKIWEEGQGPHFALELTSKKTRREDEGPKKILYAQLQVPEYFLFDPLGEWLKPPLMGFRLVNGEYVRIQPNADGGLESEQLGVTFKVEDGQLVLYDTVTGKRQLTEAEAQAAQAEARAAQAETLAAQVEAQAAQARAQAEAQAAQARAQIAQAEAQAARAQAQAAQEAAARRALEEEIARLKAQQKMPKKRKERG